MDSAGAAEPLGSFAEFVRRTSYWDELDAWQIHLCNRLERLSHEKRQRLLIHAPPQFGKSCIVSQRFPCWLLGQDPRHRVKLACYNVVRATSFSESVLYTMRESRYKMLFPDTSLPRVLSAKRWHTEQREALADAQPSFSALGLRSGFVGEGADTLIIDDPYASSNDANSTAINERIWGFWEGTARPRLRDANVIVMFHRYHEEDLAGKLLREGGWEMLRYSAVCDDVTDDPLGRSAGELLSPRFDLEFLKSQQRLSPSTYLAQFQGRPLPLGGGILKKEWFEVIPSREVADRMARSSPPEKVVYWALGVDLAVTAKRSADYTVALPGMITSSHKVYLCAPFRKRVEWPDGRRSILELATRYDVRFIGVDSTGPQKAMAQEIQESCAFCHVKQLSAVTDKQVRARMWAPIAEQRRVFLVEDGSGWTEEYLQEIAQFPKGRHDDYVDATSNLMDALHVQVDPWKDAVQRHRFDNGPRVV